MCVMVGDNRLENGYKGFTNGKLGRSLHGDDGTQARSIVDMLLGPVSWRPTTVK